MEHAKELCEAGINPLTLSAELQELKPAMITMREVRAETLLEFEVAPQEPKFHSHLIRKATPKAPTELFWLLSPVEREIAYGYARELPQHKIAADLGLTQGAVSYKLKQLAQKMRRLKVVRAYDWEPALSLIKPQDRARCQAYLQSFRAEDVAKMFQCSQPTVSVSLQRLKGHIPAEIWEALNPKRPLTCYDFKDRVWKQGVYHPQKDTTVRIKRSASILPRVSTSEESKAKQRATKLKQSFERKTGHKL